MLYMLAMIQPIMPLIEYQVNKGYVARVLCENRNKPDLACNGKFYLQKQLKESQEESSHEHSLPQIDFSKYPISLIDNYTIKLKEIPGLRGANSFIRKKISQRYVTSLFRPPIRLS